MKESSPEIKVISHGDLQDISYGANSMRGLATSHQGAQEFEVWVAHHAPRACTLLHRHDSEEILIFFKGKGKIVAGPKEYFFEAPCTVILPAHTEHKVCNLGDEPTDAIGIIGAGSKIYDNEGTPLSWREDYLKNKTPNT